MAAKTCNVLITGANRGLGLEMVKQMIAKPCPGRQIFAGCRNPEASKCEDLRELARKHPGEVHIVQIDTSDPRSVADCAKKVGPQLGKCGLNLLINNAGVMPHNTLKTITARDMQDNFNTNLLGPIMVTKEFLSYLQAASKACGKAGMSCKKSAVINISTLLGSMARTHETFYAFPVLAYRITKAGLNMLTVCNALEFKEDGILFVALHPGWVRTELGGQEADISPKESVEGMLRVMESLSERQNGAYLDYKGEVLPF
ncbi:uncharacterized protein LOC114794684 [Denticeps clupeoides]|uniref:C-factor-like n=1 Tax=Denticeps clupeoides TaxID=299321 RepID=A0AAY4BWW4_9TELE|nr:uncharacterized protein LOC114794684 [Denticeps clupeoides]